LLIDPSTGPQAGGTIVELIGRYFQTGAKVYFGGNVATDIVVVSGNLITCWTPVHAPGAVDVVVRNPNGQEGTLTNGYTFQ